MKIRMKNVQLVSVLLIILSLAATLLFAALTPRGGKDIDPLDNAADIFEEHKIDLTEYLEITEETASGWYIVYYPKNIPEGENVPVYYSITDKDKKEVMAFGSMDMSLDELNGKIRSPKSNKLYPPSESDIYLPDGRIRRFLSPSIGKGKWARDIATYDPKTGAYTERAQLWNNGSTDPAQPERRILRIRFLDSGKEYLYFNAQGIWKEVNPPEGKPPEELKLDPYTYLPVKPAESE